MRRILPIIAVVAIGILVAAPILATARAGCAVPLLPKLPGQTVGARELPGWIQKNVQFDFLTEEGDSIPVELQVDLFDARGNRLASDSMGPAKLAPGDNFLVMFDQKDLSQLFVVMFDKKQLPASMRVVGAAVADIDPGARTGERGLVMFDHMSKRPAAYGLLRLRTEMPGQGKRRGVDEHSLGMFPPGPFPIDDQGRPIASRIRGGADYSLVLTLWDTRPVKETVESHALVMFLKAQK